MVDCGFGIRLRKVGQARVKTSGLSSAKVTPRTALLIIAILAVPAYFWFHYLYGIYVEDKVTPEMQRMKDAMMKPRPMHSAQPTTRLGAPVKPKESARSGDSAGPEAPSKQKGDKP